MSFLFQTVLDDVAPAYLEQGVAEVLVGGRRGPLFQPHGDHPVADFYRSVPAMVVLQNVQFLRAEIQFAP